MCSTLIGDLGGERQGSLDPPSRLMCGGMPLATLVEWYLEESDRVIESFEGGRSPVLKRDRFAD